MSGTNWTEIIIDIFHCLVSSLMFFFVLQNGKTSVGALSMRKNVNFNHPSLVFGKCVSLNY